VANKELQNFTMANKELPFFLLPVMDAVGIERRESSGAMAPDALQSPPVLQCPLYCLRAGERGPAARAVRCAGNTGCGASPTAGKRESFFF
jgi:hypothetical protein